MSFVEATVGDGDRLNVTVERQVAEFGDHTTVRAHLSVGITAPAQDETLEEYQSRIETTVHGLAIPLKVAVLTELNLPFEVKNGVVLETVGVSRQDVKAGTVEREAHRPQPQEQSNTSGVKVMEKNAPSARDGKTYGPMDPKNLTPWFDPWYLEEAVRRGVDTIFTGKGSNGRRFYKMNNEFVNKPRDLDESRGGYVSDEEPF
jgi:hypothetical protein